MNDTCQVFCYCLFFTLVKFSVNVCLCIICYFESSTTHFLHLFKNWLFSVYLFKTLLEINEIILLLLSIHFSSLSSQHFTIIIHYYIFISRLFLMFSYVKFNICLLFISFFFLFWFFFNLIDFNFTLIKKI